ncbi:TetR/AcrR family transcriptional regulator [Rhodococcus rhodnii]|uniref:HTH tetR-type domain-containing protein n=2 Tax=Rhodococcus rhodnii TaxID=38312 RepID=R7WNB0_9NOCA|nr:TetR/AcrR family transcriptional regulator [Rhodococcus rhodnii]EOM75499.1 hypothetical protein Rrhod_3297 [Rhodococcus rhodnii LMG 5362]TXG90488.1 TetR/AcrR family transcriptional regulator [Rhodococcus rhodnii]
MARTPDPENTARRRAAILAAAAARFAADGYDGTTVAAIARDAGMSSGNVFHYFPDKAAVFRGLVGDALPERRELVADFVAREDALPAVLEFVDLHVAEALDPLAPGLALEMFRRVGHDEELTRLCLEDAALTIDTLATLLARGQRDGSVDPDLDPAETARWIAAIVDAAFLNTDADAPHDVRPIARTTVTRLLEPRTPQESHDHAA